MFGWFRQQLFGAPRSGKWPRVRKQHLEREPECAACGRKKNLEVHHIRPFHENPELELDDGVDGSGKDGNLITLCDTPCHIVHGHLMSWMRANPEVRADCERYRQKMRNFGSVADE